MTLPFATEHLADALRGERQLAGLTLSHRRIADLVLPTGRLVACDPLVCPEMEPFVLPTPIGSFPVILNVAKLTGGDQRVAHALVRFLPADPVRWEMMTMAGQDATTLEPGRIFGYPVDAGIGCFMDHEAAGGLNQRMREEDDYFETILEEMQKNYVDTWDWTELPFGRGNLVAFSSGYGDGVYATYAGFDARGDLAVVLTDFGIVPEADDAA